MNIFFDTSALVKYFHEEKGTAVVTDLILNSNNIIFVSELSKLEFLSALHRRYRRKEIGKSNLEDAVESFYMEYSTFQVQPVTRLIIKEAEELLTQYGKEKGRTWYRPFSWNSGVRIICYYMHSITFPSIH